MQCIYIMKRGILQIVLQKIQDCCIFQSRQTENVHFMYHNQRLSAIDEFQYLGILFSKKDTFYNLVQQKINVLCITWQGNCIYL